MASLNVNMPKDLREFVEKRTENGGFETPTEYVRHLGEIGKPVGAGRAACFAARQANDEARLAGLGTSRDSNLL